MSVDTRALRDAFGCFTTGVTVVTTVPEDGHAIGLTANSFTSVSLEPPLVLWCLDKGSDTIDAFMNAQNFAINILAADQEELSNHCATPGDHSLASVGYTAGPTGSPLIHGATAYFDCSTFARHDAGDHIIFVGEVKSFGCNDREPLVYVRGRYSALHSA